MRFTVRDGDGFYYVQDWNTVSYIGAEARPLESPAMIGCEACGLRDKLNEAHMAGKRVLSFRVVA